MFAIELVVYVCSVCYRCKAINTENRNEDHIIIDLSQIKYINFTVIVEL